MPGRRAPSQPASSRQFIDAAAIQQGDGEAFARLFEQNRDKLLALAYRLTSSTADAEDVVQEAAVNLWERAPSYDPSAGRPLSWALALVRNKAIDRLRAARRRAGLQERAAVEDAVHPPAGTVPGTDGFGMDAGPLVQRGLTGLSAEQRQVLELAYFDGLSQTEIAGRLGVPLGTIKARMRRGMLTLRDALEGAL